MAHSVPLRFILAPCSLASWNETVFSIKILHSYIKTVQGAYGTSLQFSAISLPFACNLFVLSVQCGNIRALATIGQVQFCIFRPPQCKYCRHQVYLVKKGFVGQSSNYWAQFAMGKHGTNNDITGLFCHSWLCGYKGNRKFICLAPLTINGNHFVIILQNNGEINYGTDCALSDLPKWRLPSFDCGRAYPQNKHCAKECKEFVRARRYISNSKGIMWYVDLVADSLWNFANHNLGPFFKYLFLGCAILIGLLLTCSPCLCSLYVKCFTASSKFLCCCFRSNRGCSRPPQQIP